MNKLVSMTDVSAGYHNTLVLSNVNLNIYETDFLGIIGANGSGKTTLLRLLMGLISPIKGTIKYYKEDLESDKKSIGYLPQFKEFDKNFPITVMEIVLSGLMGTNGFPVRHSKPDIEKAHDMLNKFGVYWLKNRPVGQLSGGQMQRVFLCRALISSPELLILDEPDTYVDSSFAQNLNEILVELNKQIAIVLVSHDLGTILASVKNIACVNGTLHYHKSDEFSQELMEKCNCPVHIVGHGDFPHTVLKAHEKKR